jgi:hypothetical protein
MTFPKNFKNKTLTVDSVKELGGFTNSKIVKKYKNVGGLTSYMLLLKTRNTLTTNDDKRA